MDQTERESSSLHKVHDVNCTPLLSSIMSPHNNIITCHIIIIFGLILIVIPTGSGKFEVSEGGFTIVNGLIRVVTNPAQEKAVTKYLQQDDNEEEVMTTKDIYKELQLRGYNYTGAFRALKSASISGKKGHISWASNWVTFMDTMLQMMILGLDTNKLYVPTKIQKIVIDTKAHHQNIRYMTAEDRRKSVDFFFNFQKYIYSLDTPSACRIFQFLLYITNVNVAFLL